MHCAICQPYNKRDNRGIIKFCLQYFRSTRQLRTSVYTVRDLSMDNRRLSVKVSLLQGAKEVQKGQTNKAYTYMSTAKFNENIYLKAKKDVSEYCLRIQLYDVPTERCGNCLGMSSVIGVMTLRLGGISLDLDTAIEMKLGNPRSSIQQAVALNDVKISRSETIEEYMQHLKQQISPTMGVKDITRLIRNGFRGWNHDIV